MPIPPQYFGYDAKINKFQPLFFEEASKKAIKELTPEQINDYFKSGKVTIIDIRGT